MKVASVIKEVIGVNLQNRQINRYRYMELIVQLNMRVSYIITTHYYYFIVCIIYMRNKENILMAFVKYV